MKGEQAEAFIELGSGNYISRVWFAKEPSRSMDILFVLRRQEGRWHFDYRFRYYSDDRAHDSKDEKSIWRATLDDGRCQDETVIVETVGKSVRELAARAHPLYVFEVDELVIESDDPAVFVARMRGVTWAHEGKWSSKEMGSA